MKSRHLALVSAASWSTWAFVMGCGSGGGYTGAFSQGGRSGSQNVAAGAGAGGMNSEGAGVGGADGGGLAGGGVGGAQAGNAGAAAGMTNAGGLAGDASAGAAGSGVVAGGGAGGRADGGVGGALGGALIGGAASGGGGAGMSGGNGGAGGKSGGAGGAGKAGSSGASGGSSGSGGSDGALRTCGERCAADADCRPFGLDQGYRCNQGSHRCERFGEPCRTSIECLPGNSFWIFACNSDSDCFFFSDDLCVDVGGVGRCARLAPSPTGCESPNSDEVMLPRYGAAGSALVCANLSHTCADGACVPGCASNADCTPQRNGSVCDTNTRLCRCVSDADCGGPGVSHCNVTSGRCECSDERDCAEVPNSNVCTSGRCGCSSVAACNVERTFPATTYVCE